MSNVKYVGSDTEELEKGKIHSKEVNKTGCGFRTDKNSEDWKLTSQAVNCNKKGCK